MPFVELATFNALRVQVTQLQQELRRVVARPAHDPRIEGLASAFDALRDVVTTPVEAPVVGFKGAQKRKPCKSSAEAAAYDVYAKGDHTIAPGDVVMVGTAVHVQPPVGWSIDVRSRSGLASKGIFVANQPGLIDSDYTGELKVLLYNSTAEPFDIADMDRIAQIQLHKQTDMVFEDGLRDTDRGESGFGSTGE